jgi:hypothetical protein
MSGLALAQPPPGTPAGCDPKDSLHEPPSDQVISEFHLVGESTVARTSNPLKSAYFPIGSQASEGWWWSNEWFGSRTAPTRYPCRL